MSPLGAPTPAPTRADALLEAEPTSAWNRTISELEQALGTGDAEAVARVAIDVSLGKVPSHLEGRARDILEQITGMESDLAEQRTRVSSELSRLSGRSRFVASPAPSQLDCSA